MGDHRSKNAAGSEEGTMKLHGLSQGRRSATYVLAWMGALFAYASPAEARVTQLQISTVESPTFSGTTFGAVGAYERIEGRIVGEVDPHTPHNRPIVDIDLAPTSSSGMVTYSADFQILRPIDLTKGNHRILFDLPNRGGATARAALNDTTIGNNTTTAGDPGNGFLMNLGYTLVEGAWDITAAQGGKLFGVTFPVTTNRDGSAITGPATEEFVIDESATPATEPLTYPPATADQPAG